MTSWALTAERGAGKSTLAAEAARVLGARHVSVSGWLRATLVAAGEADGPDELRAVGARAAADPGRLVQDALSHAGWSPGEAVLFDAVRHVEVLTALRTAVAPDAVVHVALALPNSARLRRLTGRGDAHAALGGAEHSTEAQVSALIHAADHVLDAQRSVTELVNDLRRLAA